MTALLLYQSNFFNKPKGDTRENNLTVLFCFVDDFCVEPAIFLRIKKTVGKPIKIFV